MVIIERQTSCWSEKVGELGKVEDMDMQPKTKDRQEVIPNF